MMFDTSNLKCLLAMLLRHGLPPRWPCQSPRVGHPSAKTHGSNGSRGELLGIPRSLVWSRALLQPARGAMVEFTQQLAIAFFVLAIYRAFGSWNISFDSLSSTRQIWNLDKSVIFVTARYFRMVSDITIQFSSSPSPGP